jgi:hypothetical protein
LIIYLFQIENKSKIELKTTRLVGLSTGFQSNIQ